MTGDSPFPPAQPPAPTAADVPAAGPERLELPAGKHHLCACGRSRHGWHCDGAHLGSGRVSHALELQQPTSLWMCGCGRSRRYPFCDGRHQQPPRRWWRLW